MCIYIYIKFHWFRSFLTRQDLCHKFTNRSNQLQKLKAYLSLMRCRNFTEKESPPTYLYFRGRSFMYIRCMYVYIYVCVTHIHVYIYIYYLKIYDIPIKCWTTPYFQPCGNSVGTATSSGEEGTPLMPVFGATNDVKQEKL